MARSTHEQVCRQDRRILLLLREGKTVREIARALAMSDRGVRLRIADMRDRYRILEARMGC